MNLSFTHSPRRLLRIVLLSQLAIGALLVASDVANRFPRVFQEKVDLPSTPVSPGDQKRHYRTDRTNPELLPIDGPLDLSVPDKFPSRLDFSESQVDGLGKVLLITGKIEQGDSVRFQNHLSNMAEKPDLVALHSPGGLVFEALDIGATIRENGASTGVLAGAFCMSSCPYVLAGGEDRLVSKRAIVGLHQHYYDQPKYLPVGFAVEDIQYGQGETMEFLIEMGIDPSLMLYSLKTPPEQIYALVEEELIETKIATEVVD